LQPVDQSIQPPSARIVEAVEPQQDKQELLLDSTEGIVEDQHLVVLGQLFLLPGGAKAQVFPYHVPWTRPRRPDRPPLAAASE
jgi:hypothetical protein